MTSETPTPRTDAEQHNMGSLVAPHYVVDIEFARTLERECSALREKLTESDRALARSNKLVHELSEKLRI